MDNKFIKGGVVTRIDVLSDCDKKLANYFNLDMFLKKNNSYFLKDDMLENIKILRKELLSLTRNRADSIDEADAYLFEISGDKILEKGIFLTNDHKRYYYGLYGNNVLETVFSYEMLDNIKVRIYFIPIIWITDRIEIRECKTLKIFLNGLIRKALNNILKDAFFITMTN